MATTKCTTTTTTTTSQSQSQNKRCNSSSTSSSSALVEPKAKAISMDPTVLKKHTKSKTITALTPPDPIAPSPPPSTIQNISNRFAKLYANHKILASLKGSSPAHSVSSRSHYIIQEKGLNNSADLLALDFSCVALTKSNSQHGRTAADLGKASNCTRTKVKEKDNKYYPVVNVKKQPHHHHHHHQDVNVHVEKALLARKNFNEVKKTSSTAAKKEKKKNKEFDDEKDVKKASSLMSKSLELDNFNRVCEMKRPIMSLAVNGGGGGRRKSFCCSQTELADFFSCTGVKVVAVDMPPFMQIHAVDCARKACDSLEKFTSKTLAFTLKKEFDGVHGPAWHCIVGTSFGSFVTHSVGGFMYFSIDHKLHILLFKTTVQRAD